MKAGCQRRGSVACEQHGVRRRVSAEVTVAPAAERTDVTPAAPAAVSLRGATKRYGKHTAVDALDLDIREGEFFSLLGPSGCGKTTTLRMIAGFEQPDGGASCSHGEDVSATCRRTSATSTWSSRATRCSRI